MFLNPLRLFFLTIQFFLSFSVLAQVFDGSIYINTGDSKIIRIDSILDSPSEHLICTTTNCNLWDIGISPNKNLYGVIATVLLLVQPDGNFIDQCYLPINFANSLSFDQNGIAYIGFAESSVVLTVDLTKPGGDIKTWHDFGSGRASGDFIFLKDKLYIAWVKDSSVHLYEVIIDKANNYLGHIDLGLLPDKTYGLASNGREIIFGLTESKQIYSFSPPAGYTGVIPVTNLYLPIMGVYGYGATSMVEPFGNSKFDFGDAPSIYPTNQTYNSACHMYTKDLCLGKNVDFEDSGIPTSLADGDDKNSFINDEDGIKIGAMSIQNFSLISECSTSLSIEHTGKGFLNAWFDWDHNGKWTDDEMVISSFYMEKGNYEYPISVPPTAVEGITYCRFRFSSLDSLKSYGIAPDGEVEDYYVNVIKSKMPDSLIFNYNNSNACIGNSFTLPVKSTNFKGINSCFLTFRYDPAYLKYSRTINVNASFGNKCSITNEPIAGTISVSWISDNYISINENASLFDMVFEPLQTGQSQVNIDNNLISSQSVTCSTLRIPVARQTGVISIFNSPIVNTELDVNVCLKNDIILSGSATGNHAIVEYHWLLPDGSARNNDSLILKNADYSDAGVYSLHCTDTKGCTDSSNLNLTILPLPEINFANEDSIYFSDGYLLTAASQFDYCTWNNGATSPIIEINIEGWYWAQVSYNGCDNFDSVFMVEKEQVLLLPNAFTPNGDQLNDVYKAIGSPNSNTYFNMLIYNKWGQKIFESNEFNKGWDGTFNGKDCPTGNYTCVLNYKSKNSDSAPRLKTYRAMVLLTR